MTSSSSSHAGISGWPLALRSRFITSSSKRLALGVAVAGVPSGIGTMR